MSKRSPYLIALICGIALSSSVAPSTAFAQTTGLTWVGPGPSANVKAFGAFGDVQAFTGGAASASSSVLTITPPAGSTLGFSTSDIGKHLWVDKGPFQAPGLPTVNVGTSGGANCPGGGSFGNNTGYPIHVYYRVTYLNPGPPTLEGNPSVEGFATIPFNNPAATYCVVIGSPSGSGMNYKVYFSTDAPLFYNTTSHNEHTLFATSLDSNGDIEEVTGTGTTAGGTPPWNPPGQTTTDGSVTWLNLGPVVPGYGSGGEKTMAPVCGGSAGTTLGVSCEIDTIGVGTNSPPSIQLLDAGTITGFTNGASPTLTWAGNTLSYAISGANFAWGHDDTAAINNALSNLLTSTDPQGHVVGGTLFFPVSGGCYGITSSVTIIGASSLFLSLQGEGSASSKLLGGPGALQPQPSSACIATILSGSAFNFSSDNAMLNAGPTIENLGFTDPFGITGTALQFNMNASTRVLHNSFQGYSNGTAVQFTAGGTTNYNQFVQVSDNICLSVKSCVTMNGGITNPAWIERNRCVSAQLGGGRCVELGPNLGPGMTPNSAGGTNWIVENFALYFPISFESTDQIADYWIGNSNQQTAASQTPVIPNIIGSSTSGIGLHIGATVSTPLPSSPLCHDNEVFSGNNALNAVGLFIDPLCTSTLYAGYTVTNSATGNPFIKDFGSQSTYWNQELGMKLSAPIGVNPLTVNNQSGSTAFQVLYDGDLAILGPTVGTITIHPQAASGTYNFNLPTSAGSANAPLLSQGGGTNAMIFSPLPLGSSSSVSGVLPLANGGTNNGNFLAVAGEVYNSASAQTNNSIGAVTMSTVGGSDATYRFQYYMTQVDAGASCTGNTHVTVSLMFTDPAGGATQPVTQAFTFLALVPSSLTIGQANTFTFRAKAGQIIQYLTTYAIGSGCTTGPKYQVFPVLEQM